MGKNFDSYILERQWQATSLMWQTVRTAPPAMWEHGKYAHVCEKEKNIFPLRRVTNTMQSKCGATEYYVLPLTRESH